MLERLTSLLREAFQRDVRLDMVRSDMFQVFLPAYYPDGDMIDVFVKPLGQSGVRVCDCGLTLMRLSYAYELNSDAKRKVFQKVLKDCGAGIEKGVIYIDVPLDGIYAALMQFVQLIAKVSDMRNYQRLVAHSDFYNVVKDIIFKNFENLAPEESVVPLKNREEIVVDYVLRPNGHSPIYLYPVQGNQKAQNVIISLLSLQREKVSFNGVVIHDDFESLPAKTQKFITNAADKQFADLENFKEFGEQYIVRLCA